MKKNRKQSKDIIIYSDGLNKIYGEKRETQVHALIDVNLQIMKGEFISIMGPSGSGKTTLMNMIGMLDRPTGGSIEIAGVDTTTIPENKLYKLRRGKIGFIFQKFYLIPTLNALDNVLSPLIPLGITKKDKRNAEKLLDQVGLKDRMKHKPGELSGGELQRIAIARALIQNPPIVLADEPTGNLDSKTGADIISLLKEFNKKYQTTFVVVTHDPRVAKATERVVFLEDGKTSLTPTVDMNVVFK